MFLKNHAKSNVFQNSMGMGNFLNFLSNLSKIFIFLRTVSKPSPTKPLLKPPGYSAGFTPSAKREFDGMGLDGMGYQNCPSIFVILCGDIYLNIQ